MCQQADGPGACLRGSSEESESRKSEKPRRSADEPLRSEWRPLGVLLQLLALLAPPSLLLSAPACTDPPVGEGCGCWHLPSSLLCRSYTSSVPCACAATKQPGLPGAHLMSVTALELSNEPRE